MEIPHPQPEEIKDIPVDLMHILGEMQETGQMETESNLIYSMIRNRGGADRKLTALFHERYGEVPVVLYRGSLQEVGYSSDAQRIEELRSGTIENVQRRIMAWKYRRYCEEIGINQDKWLQQREEVIQQVSEEIERLLHALLTFPAEEKMVARAAPTDISRTANGFVFWLKRLLPFLR